MADGDDVVVIVVLEALVYPFKGVFELVGGKELAPPLSLYSLCHVTEVIKAGS